MKIALIGFGSMGKNHYRILRHMPNVELTAVCDPRINGRLSEKSYTDIDTMFEEEKLLNAAVICVPTSHHMEIALKCIEKGIHILIEKPLAANVMEGMDILNAVKHHKVKAAVGHIERFNPVVHSLKDKLRDKRILGISIFRVGPFPPRNKDVGVLIDLSVHDIDLIRFITDKKRIVESRVFKMHHNGGPFEDNAVIALKLENEVIASVTTNWLTPFKKRTIEVATESAYYEADLITQELRQYTEYQVEDNSFVIHNCSVKKGEPLQYELESFCEYIRTGEIGNLATLEDGLKTLEIIHKRRNGHG